MQTKPSLFAPRASRRLGITQYLLPDSLLKEKKASVRTFLTPIFALMISAVFFGERLQLIQAAGIALSLYSMWRISR